MIWKLENFELSLQHKYKEKQINNALLAATTVNVGIRSL